MARDKNRGNGGTNGEGGAPAEATAPEASLASDVTTDAPVQQTTPSAEPSESVIPPDAQVPQGAATEPATNAHAVDIEAVQARFVGRLPELFSVRTTLAKLEGEHEADGDVIADVLIGAAKASKASPTIELGGVLWRAKHDAEKRGGKPHLHELVRQKPLVLGNKSA